ncbi:MAG TPA: hypothetical protein PLY93_00385 [Turneriella sp.]|nr:hypothetical protein [Turneriella sp.]
MQSILCFFYMLRKLCSLFFIAFLVHPLYAYTDPGTGSLALQVFLASALTAWVSVKLYGRKIKNYFSHFFDKEQNDSVDEVPALKPATMQTKERYSRATNSARKKKAPAQKLSKKKSKS